MKFVLPDLLLFQLLKLVPGYSLCLSLLLASDSTIRLLESVLPSVWVSLCVSLTFVGTVVPKFVA